MLGSQSDFSPSVIVITIVITLLVFFFFSKKKTKEVQLLMGFMSVSFFLYSGFGISMKEVDNMYLVLYLLFLIFLFLPFKYIKNGQEDNGFSDFDRYILKRQKTIKHLCCIYMFLSLIPCIYPEFKLNNISLFFSPGNLVDIFDTYSEIRVDVVYKLSNTLSFLFTPFYYIYIGMLVNKGKKTSAFALVIIEMLLRFCPTAYLGRGKLMIYAFFLLFILFPPIKNGKFEKKSFFVLFGLIMASVPLLYAFMFFRLGQSVESAAYGVILNEMLLSEFTYPEYYDEIMRHSMGAEGIITMILWILCLPVPSVLWASKPVIDKYAFTTMVTGLEYGDRGFSILLPSALGESIQFGGLYFFGAYAFIVGIIYAYFTKVLVKNKTLHFIMLHTIICCVELGRSGAGAILPSLINENLSLFLICYLYNRNISQQNISRTKNV